MIKVSRQLQHTAYAALLMLCSYSSAMSPSVENVAFAKAYPDVMFQEKDLTSYAAQTLFITQESKQLVNGTYKLWEERQNGSIVYVAAGKDNARIILDNVPEADGSYKYKYRQQLETLTGVDTGKLAYTGRALTQYLNQANLAADSSYVAADNAVRTDFTLYAGLGFTNNAYVGEEKNPNSLLGVLEIQARNERWNRHAAYAQYRYSGANEDDNFDYRSHQLSLGYRFFILDSSFKAFASLKVASITINTQPVGLFDEEMLVGFEDNTGVNVNAPIAPGIGLGYTWDSWGVQVQWHDLVAAGLDGNGEIGTDFTLGTTYTF